jgi:cytosine/adenosine deaminase-related metal-dependent hydrolase
LRPRSFVLREGNFYRNGKFELCDIKVQNGIITEIDSQIPSTDHEKVVELSGLYVIPALINSHDHLEFNLFPKLGNPPYRNYVEWTSDVQKNYQDEIKDVLKVPLKYRLLWSAYKNIFSGATTVIHHNKYHWNFLYGYPVEVYRHYNWIHSLAIENKLQKKLANNSVRPLIIHLAEGTDALANGELQKLYNMDKLKQNTVIVHGIGLTDNDINLIIEIGASLIWCPTSNLYLYNATAPIEKLIGKIPFALGTDATISGGRSLFEEMRLARKLKNLSVNEILGAVTLTPAKIFSIPKGQIEVGASADLLLFKCGDDTPLEKLIALTPSDIVCLLRKGRLIYGDPDSFNPLLWLTKSYSRIVINQKEKLIIGDFQRIANTIKKILPSYEYNEIGIEQLEF